MGRFKKWLIETKIRIKLESRRYFKQMGKIGWVLTSVSFVIQFFPEMHHWFMDIFKVILGIGAGMVWVSMLSVRDHDELVTRVRRKEDLNDEIT